MHQYKMKNNSEPMEDNINMEISNSNPQTISKGSSTQLKLKYYLF